MADTKMLYEVSVARRDYEDDTFNEWVNVWLTEPEYEAVARIAELFRQNDPTDPGLSIELKR